MRETGPNPAGPPHSGARVAARGMRSCRRGRPQVFPVVKPRARPSPGEGGWSPGRTSSRPHRRRRRVVSGPHQLLRELRGEERSGGGLPGRSDAIVTAARPSGSHVPAYTGPRWRAASPGPQAAPYSSPCCSQTKPGTFWDEMFGLAALRLL